MAQSKYPQRVAALSALLLAFCAIGSGVAGAQTADDPLKMVPGDCLFCVRINNLDAALGQVDMFLSGVIPMGVSMPVKAQLGQLLGSPDAKGVNTAGSFMVFGPLPGGNPDPTRIGILVPVSDYEQFVSGNPNVSPASAVGVSSIGPQGNQMLAVTQVGNYALATLANGAQALPQAKQALSASTRGLSGSLDSAELQRATSAPVWLYGNVQLAGRMFGPMLQAQLAQTKSMLEQMEAQGTVASTATTAVDMYSTMLNALTQEARYLSLAVEPSAGRINAGFVLAAVPGSTLAGMLEGAASKPVNNLVGYLDSGAAVYFSGSMKSPFWQKINEAYIDMLPQLLGGELSEEQIAQFKQMTIESAEALAGPVAGSLSVDVQNKPPFQVQYVAAVTDPEKFRQSLDNASKMMNSGPIAEFYEKMGMKFTFDVQRNAETYKGVAIDAIKFNMTPTDSTSDQGQALSTMYGDGFNVQLAVTDGLLVYALAQDPGPQVHALIDQIKGSGPGQVPGQMRTAMQLIPGSEKADFFMTYNLLRAAQLVTALSPTPLPISLPPTAGQSQTGIAIAGNVSDGKIALDVAVPQQQVAEVMQLVMQMQMQQMQQSMEGGGEG